LRSETQLARRCFFFPRSDVDTDAEIKPVIHDEGITYSYVMHNSLYLLAVSRTNVNAVSVLYFLHRLVDVFKFYFEARHLGLLASCASLCRRF
jgi:hypothetical protein